jgi:hypothetical protein
MKYKICSRIRLTTHKEIQKSLVSFVDNSLKYVRDHGNQVEENDHEVFLESNCSNQRSSNVVFSGYM